MIEPTDRDIGRKVVYLAARGTKAERREEGVVTSFNDHYVFVRYGGTTSAATQRKDLEWMVPSKTERRNIMHENPGR